MTVKEYGSDFHFFKFNNNKYKISIPANSILFGCGRFAFNHLISYHLNNGLWKTIYIPEYFCYEVIDSIKKTGINVKYYSDFPLADDDNLLSKISFNKRDVVLRINYFGMRGFRDNSKINVPVIEDHSHNLFSDWANKSNADWCIASLRKTLPIPDGGILWSPQNKSILKPSISKEHILLSEKRNEAMLMKQDYLDNNNINKNDYLKIFNETEISLGKNNISGISDISEKILHNIPKNIDDFKLKNYNKLKELINLTNISIINNDSIENPFSLILFFKSKKERDFIQKYLVSKNVYPAILWTIDNVNATKEVIKFSERMLSIHVDFRYSEKDMVEISKIINKGLKELEN